MSKALTPTQLRRDVYRILDDVLETGVPQEVVRKGESVLLVPLSGRRRRLENLPQRRGINCTLDELIATSWESEWSGEV